MVCAPVRRDNPRALTSVDHAHYGVSRAKECVSVDCGARCPYRICIICHLS